MYYTGVITDCKTRKAKIFLGFLFRFIDGWFAP
jgi:hypothetical protein